MKKQIIIAIIIVLLIVVLNIITQKYTEIAMGEVLDEMLEIRNNIKEGNEIEVDNRDKKSNRNME